MSSQQTSPQHRTQDPRQNGPAVTISNQMVRLLARYVGRGPTKARTTLTENLVVITFGDTLTRAEENLVAIGETEAVFSMRRVFHTTMRAEAVQIIEEILGRAVAAFLSDIDTGADIAIFAFVLAPREPGDSVAGALE